MNNALPSRWILLGTQLLFNVGFYAVVPFLAIHMREDLLFGSAMIGLVLGIRTFSQQGFFFLGGILSEKLGYRSLMLLGCAVRVMGYLGLAFAVSPAGMIAGACLTGIGGAMFSPCLEALVAQVDAQEKQGEMHGKQRASLFALFSVCGEVGAVGGPLLGALLLGWGFQAMAASCALVFALAAVLLYKTVPAGNVRTSTTAIHWRSVLGNRPFMVFALAYSTYLFSYNQLYMALPAEIDRVQVPGTMLARLFALASGMVVFLQMPIATAWKSRPAHWPLGIGFTLMSLAFVVLAVADGIVSHMPSSLPGKLAPSILFVVLLSLGQMCVVPVAMSLVPRFAHGQSLAMHYGLLASVGGCMVLFGNVLLGLVQDHVAQWMPTAGSHIPMLCAWLFAAAFPAASAWWMFRMRLSF